MVQIQKMIKKILTNYKTWLFIIIIFAGFLRFYNYENRWGLAHDQARDAIVVRYSMENKTFPSIGPFSASGPFVFGPHWYWIFIGVTSIYPSSVLTPWIFQGIMYVVIVFLMFLLGRVIGGFKFGLLASLFTAVSTAQIAQSTNLSYSSFIGFTSVVALYLAVLFIKEKKTFYLFLIGFIISLSVNIHFQAIGMLFLIPIIFLLGKMRVKDFPVLFLGFFIPLIPLIIFDLNSNFFESRGLIEYLFNRKEGAYLPKRWLTYAFETWPLFWSRVLGGHVFLGYLTGILLAISIALSFIKKELTKPFIVVIVFFLVNFIVLRYHKGPTYDAFIVYLHSAIIILVTWLSLRIISFNKLLGGFFVLSLVIGSLNQDYKEIKFASNTTAERATKWRDILIEKYPNSKFAIYDYEEKYTSQSFSLALFLQVKKKTDENGIKIGVSIATPGASLSNKRYELIDDDGLQLLYLDEFDRKILENGSWKLVTPSALYNRIQNWYK